MNSNGSHKDLVVWQKAIALASKVYAATQSFPTHERAGLARELRRAAVSIASHVAAGAARRTSAEFGQCLHIARDSLSELETQVLIAHDQRLIDIAHLSPDDITEVGRLLSDLIRSVAQSKQSAHAKACSYRPTASR